MEATLLVLRSQLDLSMATPSFFRGRKSPQHHHMVPMCHHLQTRKEAGTTWAPISHRSSLSSACTCLCWKMSSVDTVWLARILSLFCLRLKCLEMKAATTCTSFWRREDVQMTTTKFTWPTVNASSYKYAALIYFDLSLLLWVSSFCMFNVKAYGSV